MLHCDLSESLIRPPGVPPSQCRGELVRVAPDGMPIDPEAPAIADDAQRGEGDVGQAVGLSLWKCRPCRRTLVIADCPDGCRRERNEYPCEPTALAASA